MVFLIAVAGCSEGVPPRPVLAVIRGPSGTLDLDFDRGRALSARGDLVVASTFDGGVAPLAAPGPTHQLAVLANGDYVVSGEIGVVSRVTEEGGVAPIASVPGAWGLAVAPDGRVVVAAGGLVVAVDVASGVVEPWFTLDEGYAKSVAFDGDTLLVGTVSRGGEVLAWDGALSVFGHVGPDDAVIDAVIPDRRGGLWVCEYSAGALHHLDAGGREVHVIRWAEEGLPYAHGGAWGSGEGGFREDAVYFATPEAPDQITELVP